MKFVVVDDHSLFRDGIISLLEAGEHEVIGEARNGLDAIDVVDKMLPDVVLMDIGMPVMNGLDALQKIKERHSEIQVVILTVSESEDDLMKAIEYGANGYMLKNLDAENFLELVNGLERGEAAVTRKIAAMMMKGFVRDRQEKSKPSYELTAREIELLQLVASGQSNKAIANQVGLSENTIKYHMRNIMKKMGAQNRTEAVTTALREGIIQQVS